MGFEKDLIEEVHEAVDDWRDKNDGIDEESAILALNTFDSAIGKLIKKLKELEEKNDKLINENKNLKKENQELHHTIIDFKPREEQSKKKKAA